MRKVNEPPPEAPGPAWYTVLTTTHDEVVTPYQSQALAGDRATNVILQDRCPADPFEHVTIVGDPVALQWAVNALERPGAANPNFVPDCTGLTYGHDPDGTDGAGRPPAAARRCASSSAAARRRSSAGAPASASSAAGPSAPSATGGSRRGAGRRPSACRRARPRPADASRKARRVQVRALMPRPGGGVQVAKRRYRLH